MSRRGAPKKQPRRGGQTPDPRRGGAPPQHDGYPPPPPQDPYGAPPLPPDPPPAPYGGDPGGGHRYDSLDDFGEFYDEGDWSIPPGAPLDEPTLPRGDLSPEDLLAEEATAKNPWDAAPAHEPTERKRQPFGGNLHMPTSVSNFQPELQTRIIQNPFSDEQIAADLRGGTAQGQAAAVPEPDAAAGTVVVLFSCHGGTGSTVLATNIGAAVAQISDEPTCVVDLDLQLGDVLTLLGLETDVPMSKVAADMEAIDWEMLAPLLSRHASGLCALSQVGHIEELSELDPGRIPTLLRYLQGHFGHVVVDGLRDFNDHALAALDVADRIVMVATQDVASVRGAGMRLEILRRLGYPTDKISLVLNRFDKRSTITLEQISRAVGFEPMALIPNDYKTVNHAITGGVTLAEVNPKAKVTRAVEQAARLLFDLPEPPKKGGIFGRIFGKGK